MPTIMQKGPAPFKYVHTRVIQYYSSIVDLRWCRSIHSCDVCPHRFQKNESKCNSVHYGICSPVVSVPMHARTRGANVPASLPIPVRKISIPIRVQVIPCCGFLGSDKCFAVYVCLHFVLLGHICRSIRTYLM